MPPLPALVCVPGLGLDAAAWRPTLDALGSLEPRDPVASGVVLLPGYGERVPRGTGRSPAALGRALVDQLDRLVAPGTPVVLAGHSASCQVVAEAAARAQDRVRGLVLVGPTTDPRGRSRRALAARWLATARRERPGQVPTLVRRYTRTGLVSMARGMGAARRHDLLSTLADVRCPVLVVRGERDRICPADWARQVAATGPGAEHPASAAVTLGSGAHMVPLTHGPLVARELRRYLALVT